MASGDTEIRSVSKEAAMMAQTEKAVKGTVLLEHSIRLCFREALLCSRHRIMTEDSLASTD
ncbi:MAG: hypothetical protein K0S45_3442 [Nitrospira sp.]|jgi:hypothetical protein|nr:hypothetical protein [Nitrospira sp.]